VLFDYLVEDATFFDVTPLWHHDIPPTANKAPHETLLLDIELPPCEKRNTSVGSKLHRVPLSIFALHLARKMNQSSENAYEPQQA